MILPTPRMAWIAMAGALLVAVGYAVGIGLWALLFVNLGLLVVSGIELALLPRRKELIFKRVLPARADMEQPFHVEIHGRSPKPLMVSWEIQDDVPQTFIAPKESMAGRWRGKTATIAYTTAGKERGNYPFSYLRIRLKGPFGLWMKQTKVFTEQEMKIFPDLSGVRGILASMQNQFMLEGKKVNRKERTGSELHAIREYIPDDDPRLINWKATARTGTLMTSEFRPERGKVVMLMLDCGRMMGIELNNRTKLDATIEAALSLAAVALKQGDKVGLIAFSNEIKAYVPPATGMKQLQVMTEAIYDLKSDFVEASYSFALQYLMKVQKKRSLIVLFSDMDNYMFDSGLRSLLLRMRRQHYLLLLGLRDDVLHEWTLIDTKKRRDAFNKSIAYKFTMDRQAATAHIRAAGIDAIDVPVGELAWNAVNRYLLVKSQDAL
ncbi:DUF58 domain-containing protein [Halalkalibacterium halodurans]|uniref:DUF58 domain-containing protein n=1 Tax=Halalkalibacterium halodurans TaxID=86665 RepID=UPI002AA9E58E|nr:DUF58 domain-containing protein [Halalkalibacterium halodurans]MDY7221237.1 DUF58 domain-containing protein [Halalkalibacterium halodurans]MDY7240476.1 DUF58 domain-containing protein [Halalkalibacterium halodurans]